ncbi:MAG: hypothetical protein KY467_10265 [Gemmatimonadetes bacterium]|nr:hypothetical protein [Gemmatimonadota bacterium]
MDASQYSLELPANHRRMVTYASASITEAFNSMLRTDYISLNDTEKLARLSHYYVDYFNLLPEILSDTDQLIVGRRGTGKTTLLYRALVACMDSWRPDYHEFNAPKSRTLGIYVDLSKCQSLDSSTDSDFIEFEHAFVSEVCDSITDQLTRFWPGLSSEPGWFSRLFRAAENRKAVEVKAVLDRISVLLQQGLPRVVDRASPVQSKESSTLSVGQSDELSVDVGEKLAVGAKGGDTSQETTVSEKSYSTKTSYRLTVADILRILGELKEKAGLAATYIFIDEYSALSTDLQRRFSTLLKKLLGSHAGVFVKLCAITDKYTLGSSIILQRDLFELSLDLDAFVERSGTLGSAMEGLRDFAESIVSARLEAYDCPRPEDIFDDPDGAWVSLSRSAMGVPRTLGIVLKQAWNLSQQGRRSKRIRRTDLAFGIRYASTAYLNQLLGAARDGVAVPAFHIDMWTALLDRAQQERDKAPEVAASHFLIAPKYEHMLSVLNMFFLVHLLTKGRTTKKERLARSLYCFEFGMCEEHGLGFATDRNMLRQQRFAYDKVLQPFEKFFGFTAEATFRCSTCGQVYRESELSVAGMQLMFCPRDRTDLVAQGGGREGEAFTEEETKIIGTMRSAAKEDHVLARQVADDVGCYVQKVSKFGEKLERNGLVKRERDAADDRYYYYGKE